MKYSIRMLTFALLFITFPILAEDYNSLYWDREYFSNRIANDGENLWLTTSTGLIKYNKLTKNAYNAASEVYASNEEKFTAIEVYDYDDCKTICYSIDNKGPKTFDGAKVESYSTYSGWDDAYSFAMCPNGGIWASVIGIFVPPVDSTYHGIGYANGINAYSPKIPSCNLDMEFDSSGNLWIAMYGYYEYMLCFMPDKGTAKCTLSGCKKITSIAIDSSDNIWFASEDGINCYYQAIGQVVCMTKEQYPAMLENRYFGNDIDDNGNIWFTSENNLLKWDGSEFTTYTCDGYEEARSMLCDGDIVWVLLKNDTLLKFQNNEFEAIDLGPAITNTGINESITEAQNTKAFVTNEMLNIENAEGINSVVVYDATGKVITSANANGATSTQIALPSTIKGVLIVKVNNEVVKVIK